MSICIGYSYIYIYFLHWN
uniref:Uncharacterized protein n=1 Tax=Arundo donax TaxID=35708 RepID=A0A0A9GTB5_ARUDO